MNPFSATFYCLTRFYKIEGRGRRSEYWGFVLMYILVYIVIGVIVMLPHVGPLTHIGFEDASGAAGGAFFDPVLADAQMAAFARAINDPITMLTPIYFWFWIASLTASIRRMHDIGKSGWWILIVLVPFIGWLVHLIMLILPSEDADNQWGKSPYRDPQVKALSEKQLEPYKPPLREIDKHNTTEAIRALRQSRTPAL